MPIFRNEIFRKTLMGFCHIFFSKKYFPYPERSSWVLSLVTVCEKCRSVTAPVGFRSVQVETKPTWAQKLVSLDQFSIFRCIPVELPYIFCKNLSDFTSKIYSCRYLVGFNIIPFSIVFFETASEIAFYL